MNVQTDNIVLTAALDYARRGWQVFPVHPIRNGCCSCKDGTRCKSPGKTPMTPRGFKDATTDVPEITAAWSITADANVGIATGKPSGFWVLDADGSDGVMAISELEQHFNQLPRGPVARTGGGGKHYYFKMPNDIDIRNTTKLGGKQVDVRGTAGYVLAPPSNHISGKHYEWEISPEEADAQEAPEWLIALVTKRNKWPGEDSKVSDSSRVLLMPSVERQTIRIEDDLELTTAPGVKEGSRHDQLLKLVGAALARGKPENLILEEVMAWNRTNQPPSPEEEVKRVVTGLSATHQTAMHATWDVPVPFADFSPPSFPTSTLSLWLKDFVEAEAMATQTPPDMVAMVGLSTVAACVAKKVEVVINEGYREPLNLFTVTAMPPGSRKSAVFNDVTAPLRAHEAAENQRLKAKVAEAETELSIKKARYEKLKNDVLKAADQEAEQLRREALSLSTELAQTSVPTLPRLLASDTTPEKLATLLQENGGRMAVMSPEGDVFELMAGRYGNKGAANFGVYLHGHAGDDLRVDRIGRPAEFVQRPALTLGLVVQPDVIQGLADKPGFRGRGLLGRFLYCLPRSLMGLRQVNPLPVSSEVRDVYQQKILSLLHLPLPVDDHFDSYPRELTLNPGANVNYLEFAQRVERMLAPEGELSSISDWGGKLVGAVIRIAGILHIVDHLSKQSSWGEPITAETMQNAIRIGEYLIPHARAAFIQMGTDPLVDEAKAVWAWIKRKNLVQVSERDIFEGTKGRFRRMDQLKPALGVLVDHGYLRQMVQPSRNGPGRKPSPIYEVNPRS